MGCENLQVYHLSIGAACRLTWPADRLIVQVLDDSTDDDIKVSEIGSTSFYQPLLIFTAKQKYITES